ncbi:MAG: hypothetical protein ACJ736_10960 [Streptomyces sp.]
MTVTAADRRGVRGHRVRLDAVRCGIPLAAVICLVVGAVAAVKPAARAVSADARASPR